jgi:hypothetical protein
MISSCVDFVSALKDASLISRTGHRRARASTLGTRARDGKAIFCGGEDGSFCNPAAKRDS